MTIRQVWLSGEKKKAECMAEADCVQPCGHNGNTKGCVSPSNLDDGGGCPYSGPYLAPGCLPDSLEMQGTGAVLSVTGGFYKLDSQASL